MSAFGTPETARQRSPGSPPGGVSAVAQRWAEWLYDWRWRLLPPLTGITMFAMILGAVIVAPREAIEGEVQRLMYIHVPSANVMYAAVFAWLVASAIVLWKRDMRWDPIARSVAGVGWLFTGLTLATGALWGKPIWGTWWAWDARLTSTLILFLIFSAYLLARSLADESDEQVARYSAVFAVIGAVDVPIIYMSVRWWRTLHPQPVVANLEGPALPMSMLIVLLISLVAIVLLAIWLVALKSEAESAGHRLTAIRTAIDRRERA